MFDLTGKVAVVTGGNSGIGLGMATGLARAGAAVAIWGTNPDKNASAVAGLVDLGGKARSYVCDVGDPDAVTATFEQTVADFGRVDSCFANAGIGGGGPFVDVTPEQWRRVTRVDLDGVFFTLQAAARHMVERGEGGSLVATSSTSAIHGAPRNQAYAASKGGVLTMIRGVAVELARHGIRANTVVPGWVDTPMTEGAFAWEKFREKVLPRVPQRRWGVGDDFGGIAVYLAADESAYHTGDSFVIDGGYTIF